MATRNNRKNNKSRHDVFDMLRLLRKNIVMRIVLSIITILLTVVLLFSLCVAWYTNVVQTGGLTFTAEKWDFDGQVAVSDQAIHAAPGDAGIVSMSMSNQGEEIAAASVSVSKDQMDDLMKPRLYFYIDTSAVRNGERMDRVYLNSVSSYTYMLFPGSELVLNETSANAPLLKWEWIYDVLGYYVLGTGSETGSVTVEEYLRPIVYDYDETKTTFDSSSSLETIDGTITVESFLSDLSATDGYEGSIDVSKPTSTGYYPVSVDDLGYGVWAYLCTYSEIETNITTDTQMGTSGSVNCTARVTVTGRNSREQAVEVDSEAALSDALNNASVGSVRLSENVNLTTPLQFDSYATAVIDLNGHTLTSTADTIISADAGATVVAYNGTMQGKGSNIGVSSSGADISLSGVTLSNVAQGIVVRDDENDLNADSRVRLVKCSITSDQDGLLIYGNGDASARKTSIVIEKSTVTGTHYAGIICNGASWGTDIYVSDSTVTGYYTGIYHPQKDSTMTVKNSTVSGWTGLVAKGGTVNLIDCTVSGTGAESSPAYSLSGWTDTGDGVYLEANYEWNTCINISGNNTIITSENAQAVRKFKEDAVNASIVISGGNYDSDVSPYLAANATVSKSTAESDKYIVTMSDTQ